MTIKEILLFNSTVPTGEGTVLNNLTNIDINREVFFGVEAKVIDSMQADTSSAIISSNVQDDVITADLVDDIDTNIGDTEIGVDL